MKRKALLISLSIITIVIIVAGAYLAPLYFSKYPHLETTIYIRPDMTKDQLADSLKINLGEKFGGQVSTVLNLLDVDATKQVGCYKIKKNASPYQVARKLQFGVQSPVRFAFNYTRTLEQFAEKQAQNCFSARKNCYLCFKTKSSARNLTKRLKPSAHFSLLILTNFIGL